MNDQMAYDTPQELIDALQIKNVSFGLGCEYSSITAFVKDISKAHKCPMSAVLTCGKRRTYLYKCRFGTPKKDKSDEASGKGNDACEDESLCPCFVEFTRNKDESFSFKDSNWHHNHPVYPEYFAAHFCCSTSKQIEESRYQQQLKVLPGQIRTNNDIIDNSDIFYNNRRQVKKIMKTETRESFEQKCKDPTYQSHIDDDGVGNITNAYFTNIRIAQTSFAFDTIVVDDTDKTNIYDLPLETVITIDTENRSQLLSFGLLRDRTILSYADFFETLKAYMHDQEPRVILTDRSPAQISALQSTFKNSRIVYCHVHIRRDLIKYFRANDDIILGFDITSKYSGIERCEEYLEMLNARLPSLENTPGYQLIKSLVDYPERWLLSRLINFGVTIDPTTNRVEGYFGSYKKQHGFSKVTAGELCSSIIKYSKLMLTQSIKSMESTIRKYENFPCVDANDLKHIGALALDVLADEYIAYKEGKDNAPFCKWCNLRFIDESYSLPCRHLMSQTDEYIVQIDEIHPRYLRNGFLKGDVPQSQGPIYRTSQIMVESDEYVDVMARISPYVSAIKFVPGIKEVFHKTFDDLEPFQREVNKNMPRTIIHKSQFSMHPARNVLSFKPSSKKKRGTETDESNSEWSFNWKNNVHE